MAIKDGYSTEEIASNSEDDLPEMHLGDFDVDHNEETGDASTS